MTERMRDGILKRGSTYSYVVRERDPETGKRKPRWVSGFKTRTAAKTARDAARNAVSTGTYVTPQDKTVGAFLDEWIKSHSVELKPSTAASYRAKINLYLKPIIGDERVQALTPGRMSAVWKKLHESGGKDGKPVSFRTVEFARAVMRRAMQDAVLDRVITVNPVIGSKLPKRDGKPRHRIWTGPQAAGFLEASNGTRWFPLWQLAFATGMRRGELCGLRWEDVDLDAGVVSLERSTTQLGQQRVTTTPKNHERRKITIDSRTLGVLRTWRKEQAAERLQWGPAYIDSEGLVFTWENGTPVLPDYVTKEFGKAQVKSGLGLQRLVLHEARHSRATMLLRDGVPVHIVAKRLGHKDPSVTLNVYADVIPDDDGRAVEVFAKAVWGG
jgi:integrase